MSEPSDAAYKRAGELAARMLIRIALEDAETEHADQLTARRAS